MHSLLFADTTPNSGLACTAWEKDLLLSISPDDWEQIYLKIHKASINISTQKKQLQNSIGMVLYLHFHPQNLPRHFRLAGDVYLTGVPSCTYGRHALVFKPIRSTILAQKYPRMSYIAPQCNSYYTTPPSQKAFISNP